MSLERERRYGNCSDASCLLFVISKINRMNRVGRSLCLFPQLFSWRSAELRTTLDLGTRECVLPNDEKRARRRVKERTKKEVENEMPMKEEEGEGGRKEEQQA